MTNNIKVILINKLIKWFKVDTNKISDGYHTFGELYEHRIRLFIALCKELKDYSWASDTHSDGSVWEGWFIVGINEEAGEQITYHLPNRFMKDCEQARIKWLQKAPEFDGHTPADVLERLGNL